MKKKIIILGSTGSIGQKTFEIIKKNKKLFEVVLLSTHSNTKKILKQAKELNVKNIIISNKEKFKNLKNKKIKIKIYNNFHQIEKLFKKKEIFYSMVSVTGLDGLNPTIMLSKITKNLAVVNKESIICGWDLIKKNIKKYKTNFIPIDSEHYSIYSLLKGQNIADVERIYITASGGPFLNFSKKKFKNIKPKNALKHPNWKMGKKISIDSATLMNKVFEVIEAKNIFNIPYNKISILTHPKSYIHAIIKFKNGITKILAHEPDMMIPIYNSIFNKNDKALNSKSINLNILNNLKLRNVNKDKFELIKLLEKLPKKNSLYETILITINDFFVFKFLKGEINFNKLVKLILKISNSNEYLKYKKIKPKNTKEIYELRDYVSLKLEKLSI